MQEAVSYFSHLKTEVAKMSQKENLLSKAILFFFGAWLFAKLIDSLIKKQELTVYKCWNCGYTLGEKGVSECPSCSVPLYWGNPANEKSPRKVKPSLLPMISFVTFLITGIVLLACLFTGSKSPEALEGIKVLCYMSFGYSCGRR